MSNFMHRPRSTRFMALATLAAIVLSFLALYHLSGQLDGAAGVTDEQVAGMRKEAQRRYYEGRRHRGQVGQ